MIESVLSQTLYEQYYLKNDQLALETTILSQKATDLQLLECLENCCKLLALCYNFETHKKDETLKCDQATEKYVVLFTLMNEVVLTFESGDETPQCNHKKMKEVDENSEDLTNVSIGALSQEVN